MARGHDQIYLSIASRSSDYLRSRWIRQHFDNRLGGTVRAGYPSVPASNIRELVALDLEKPIPSHMERGRKPASASL